MIEETLSGMIIARTKSATAGAEAAAPSGLGCAVPLIMANIRFSAACRATFAMINASR
jgi:hypothetical protein